MNTPSPHSTPPPPGPADFRGRDISYRALSLVGGGLVALVVLAVIVNGFLFGYFRDREAERQPASSPFDAIERPRPAPMLAVDPSEERLRMEAEIDALLTAYEWVDVDAGRVRIPIQRAMELLAESGESAVAGNPGDADPSADLGSGDER
jgi:hypothetical protein